MFDKIVVVEPVFITHEGLEELKNYCHDLVCFDSSVEDEKELIKRISDADCVLVSQKTIINKTVIDSCSNLKFICMCCSYYGPKYSKVDISYAEQKNINYSYLHKYGDNGVIEYTVSSVIDLQHGFHGKKCKEEINDLTATKIGILGFGDLGVRVARAFNALGSQVYYYSKTRKEFLENEKLNYLPLDELLKTVDVLSINLNRDVCLIGDNKLQIFGNGKIIVNMSLGKCYDIDKLKDWLKNKDNFYVCDKASINNDYELLNFDNVIYVDRIIGVSKQTLETATNQILDNIKRYLGI